MAGSEWLFVAMGLNGRWFGILCHYLGATRLGAAAVKILGAVEKSDPRDLLRGDGGRVRQRKMVLDLFYFRIQTR